MRNRDFAHRDYCARLLITVPHFAPNMRRVRLRW